jgi:HK97 family phage major capsid protein
MGYETVAKALGESTGAGGGFLLQPEQGEYIESLTAGAAVRQLGPRVIPMPSGSITLPAGDGSATAYWSAESTNVSSSEPSARQVNMSAKRLTVIVPLSNELLRDSGGMAEAWVEDEAKKAATEAEDLAFIRGDGDENAPRGMLYRATSGNKFDITHAAASATSDEIYVDLGKAIRKLADNDIPMIRPGWVMSKRSEWKIRTLLNDLAIPIFKSEMDGGRLFGFPFASTTQIPNNLDTSSDGDDDESEIYFADFYSVVIGQTGGVEMSVHDAASYYNGSSVVSGLSRYETVVRLVYRVDFSSLHEGKDIAVIQSVDWA